MSRNSKKATTTKSKTAASKAYNKKAKTAAKSSSVKVAKATSTKAVAMHADQNHAHASNQNHTNASNQNQGANQQYGQVIPFRQPGWDRHHPWLANQQLQHAQAGYAKVAMRFNHGRGK